MRIVILGLGNLLYSDEGIGVHLVSKLMTEPFSDAVELVDGGTDGLALLATVEDADKLLILDAVKQEGANPGDVVILRGEQIPIGAYHKLSQHQFGFSEVLGLCKARDRLPEEMVLIGIVPEVFDWGVDVSPTVASSITTAIEAVHQQIEVWSK